ncbi:unnamed protein product [Didymodactylos carnosus]|uniref:PHD-type domain-containing protein n=1 Tax=Didymodactylos carnosus TaxID=1234261 RepID=A0A814AU49_9BILA|nr:unnamed protein product [Didymodactylos carnosus]CAF3699329.1 unnamed protein product [Didymodactylos carnosus]
MNMDEKVTTESVVSTSEQPSTPAVSSNEQNVAEIILATTEPLEPSKPLVDDKLNGTTELSSVIKIEEKLDEKRDEKSDRLKAKTEKEERRLCLLNDSNYGVVLCFMDKFRPLLDLNDYSLRQFEEHLLSDNENINQRLIDFHILLLKRLSIGKNAKREKFVSIITRFSYRFNWEDGDHLTSAGYARATINVKIRILKNLLESQFDQNQTFKVALQDKPSNEIRSQPLGRDRYGSSYWLFMDNECFIRLFRESSDCEKTWSNIAKNAVEFERFIKCLAYDQILKKKYQEWKLEIPTFFLSGLPEDSIDPKLYFDDTKEIIPKLDENEKDDVKNGTDENPSAENGISETNMKQDDENINSDTESDPSQKILKNVTVKLEDISIPPIKSEDNKEEEIKYNKQNDDVKKSPDDSKILNGTNQQQVKTEMVHKYYYDEKNDVAKRRSRRRAVSWTRKKRVRKNKAKQIDYDDTDTLQHEPEENKKQRNITNGRKRKYVDDENSTTNDGDENSNLLTPNTNTDETSVSDDRPIALRRSRRTLKTEITTPTKDKSNTQLASSQSTPTKTKRTKQKRRVKIVGDVYLSETSSDDERIISDEDDDYIEEEPDHLDYEMEIEDNQDEDDYIPSATTVLSKHRKETETDIDVDWALLPEHLSTTACSTCSKTDHPESLLLCDDCDDAYHTDCLKPALLTVPDGNWYCPLCEHKRLCEILVEKLKQIIQNYEELEAKRNQDVLKRKDRLSNVYANLNYMFKGNKDGNTTRKKNYDYYSDDEPEDERSHDITDQEKENETSANNVEKVDKQSSTTNRSDKPVNRVPYEQLGVRSCRTRNQINYRFDDYEKQMKSAILDDDKAKENKEQSDTSDDELAKKKRRYEEDGDFSDGEKGKKLGHSSEEEDEDENEQEELSGEELSDTTAHDRRQKNRSCRPSRRKSNRNSHGDDFASDDASVHNDDYNSESDDFDSKFDSRRRSTRNKTNQKYAFNDDEDEKRKKQIKKKRRSDDDSFESNGELNEDKSQSTKKPPYRASITDHLNRLFVDRSGHANSDREEDEDDRFDSADEDVSWKRHAGKRLEDGEQDLEKKKLKTANNTGQNDGKKLNDNQNTTFSASRTGSNSSLLNKQTSVTGVGFNKVTMGPLIQRPSATIPRHPVHSYQTPMADPTLRWQTVRPPEKLANMVSNTNGSISISPRWPLPRGPPPISSQTMNGHNAPHLTTTLPPSPLQNEKKTFTLLQSSQPQSWNGQTFPSYPYQQTPITQQQFSNQHLYPVSDSQTSTPNDNLYNLNPVQPSSVLPSPINASSNFSSLPSHDNQASLKIANPVEQTNANTKQDSSPVILTELLKNDNLPNSIKESGQVQPLAVNDDAKFMIGDIKKANVLSDTQPQSATSQ